MLKSLFISGVCAKKASKCCSYLKKQTFFQENNQNVQKTYEDGYEFTKKQLDGWGFKYYELIMGKPSHHINIDDKNLFFKNDWQLIRKKIKEKANEAIY